MVEKKPAPSRQGIHSHLFDRKVLIALVVGAILLGLLLTFAARSVASVQRTSEAARATQAFHLQLNVVYQTILNMETGQRGYLLTSSDEYREPYERSRRELPAQMDLLEKRMTDSAEQRRNVTALAALLEERQGQMAHALELHGARGVDAAMDFVRTNRGHRTMIDIRALLSRMLAEEERVLSQRRAEEAATLQRNFWLSATLAALVAALLIAVYALVRRESAVRAHAAEQLERTNASLAEANAARARLLAAASHDLRQPLQTLTLLNATLKEEPLSPLAARIVETQLQTLGSMSRLVHALLSINRLESGTIQPEIRDVDLGAMLRQLRNELLPLARARRLSLEIEDGDVWVRSDATLLREILQNLLSNAIRHTDHGQVSLRAATRGKEVQIEVADTGPGIPEDKRELIFEEFQQLEAPADRRREGFGLGLSIVRHAARALGMKLDLSSAVGVGTTFRLDLPLGAAPAAPSTASEHARNITGRILLVDDEDGVRNALALFLRVTGHEVIDAASPEQALATLESAPPPDVVVSDYQLRASLDGGALVQRVRETLGAEIPAVILTGDTTRIGKQYANAPNCRILHKPVDAQQLADHLQNVLAERAPAARELRRAQ